MGRFQQLGRGGDNHQRRAQFVTDIAGKQPFTLQRQAQLAEGGVEGLGQMANLVVRVFRRQWRRQRQQLIPVSHLTGQPDDRRQNLLCYQQTQQTAQQHTQQEAGKYYGKQHPLAGLELGLLLHQNKTLRANLANVDIGSLIVAHQFAEAPFERAQRLRYLVARHVRGIQPGLAVEPGRLTAGQVLLQYGSQFLAHLLGDQMLLDKMHNADNPQRKHPADRQRHQREGDYNTPAQRLLANHCAGSERL